MLTPVNELANVIVDVTVVPSLVTAILRLLSLLTVLNVSVNKSSDSEPLVPVIVNDVLMSAQANTELAPIPLQTNTCPSVPLALGNVNLGNTSCPAVSNFKLSVPLLSVTSPVPPLALMLVMPVSAESKLIVCAVPPL